MDDLGVRREGGQLAGDPVVEPRAEGDEEVGLLQGGDGGHGAVHTRHTQVQRVAVGDRAAGHERGDDRDLGEVDEGPQDLRGASPDHAAADVEPVSYTHLDVYKRQDWC